MLTVPPQRSDVVRALHATAKSESWTECRGLINQEFYKSPSSIELLPKVLQQIPVLLFAGDQDFICNYMGIESMIKAMSWNGGTGLGVSSFLCLFGEAWFLMKVGCRLLRRNYSVFKVTLPEHGFRRGT
jgi:hypothetical protein